MKVNIFVWRMLLGQLPTTVKLEKRWVMISNVRCPICEWEDETMVCLFSRFEVAKKMWESIFRLLDIKVGNFCDPSDLLEIVEELKINNKKRKVVEGIVFTDLWVIWKFRNDVLHDSKNIRKKMIMDSIQEQSFLWLIRKNIIVDSLQELSFLWLSSRQHKLLFSWVFGSKTFKYFVIS